MPSKPLLFFTCTNKFILLSLYAPNIGEIGMKEFSYGDIEAAANGFSLDRLIGKGSHGCVYKATLKGGKIVAVKKPSRGLQILGDTSKLDNEIAVLSSVVKGPNIVNLLGVSICPASNEKLMVMDFMPRGSLHDLLHSSPLPPTWPRRAAIALQIARAVSSLHASSPPVIHRDIKSANVLFDARRNARLADFSLAVMGLPDSPAPAGTMGYLDPCYTAPGKLGPRNDVFSFGVVLLEIVSSRRAMDVERDPASIVAWAAARRAVEVCDRRVAVPAGSEAAVGRMVGVAARCVSGREELRPTMAEVVAELTRVAEEVGCPVWGGMRRCVRAWRRCVSKRVTTTTKIVVLDHLIDGSDEPSMV